MKNKFFKIIILIIFCDSFFYLLYFFLFLHHLLLHLSQYFIQLAIYWNPFQILQYIFHHLLLLSLIMPKNSHLRNNWVKCCHNLCFFIGFLFLLKWDLKLSMIFMLKNSFQPRYLIRFVLLINSYFGFIWLNSYY